MIRATFVSGAIALVFAAAAATAAVTVSLNLEGGYANRTIKACALTHHYTFFHSGRSIAVKGAISPAPSGTVRLKLKIKRCVLGRFRTVWIGAGVVQPDGTFHGTLPPRRRGYFFARAYYEGPTTVESDKQYFRAT